MKFIFPDPAKNKNLPAKLREAGYHLERLISEQETAFVKSFEGADFPRWHLYVSKQPAGWELNLHLDQKRPVYRGSSAHAGEYDGSLLEKEMSRIKTFLVGQLFSEGVTIEP